MQNLKSYLSITLLILLISFTIGNSDIFTNVVAEEEVNFKTIFADIASRTTPAVVKVKSLSTEARTNFDYYNYEAQNEEKIMISGTGFIIDKEGYLLTNQHIVNKSEEITIIFDNQEFSARKIGSDFNLDLALLKIEDSKQDFPTIDLAQSDDSSLGEWVIAISNTDGYNRTVTIGIISSLNRSIELKQNSQSRSYHNLIQTDAAINPGNSGGPLLNIAGEVIGINTAIDTDKQNVSYAVSTNKFKDLIDELKEHGKILRPWIGLHIQQISPEVAEFMKLKRKEQTLITNIDEESPAAEAGIEAGDIIVSLNDVKIKNPEQFRTEINQISIGEKILLSIFRDEEIKEFELEIKTMPHNN